MTGLTRMIENVLLLRDNVISDAAGQTPSSLTPCSMQTGKADDEVPTIPRCGSGSRLAAPGGMFEFPGGGLVRGHADVPDLPLAGLDGKLLAEIDHDSGE